VSAEWRVPIGTEETTAVFEPATEATAPAVFVFAHGAGGNMSDRGMLAASAELRRRGLDVVRFNFLYKEKRSGRPDPMPILKKSVAAVVERVREERHPARVIIGGRSMGGRAASMLAADGFPCDGLLLLAYPLHPEGKPEQLRDAHLPAITTPTLCINGTRDALCRRDLMEAVLERVGPRFQMRWLEGADHMFHVLKSSGRTDAEVLAEAGAAAEDWFSSVLRMTSGSGRTP
jgi:predicted alpha/beta-hydrolase family hydrolase